MGIGRMIVRSAVRSAVRAAARPPTYGSAYAPPATASSGCLTPLLYFFAIGGSLFGLLGLLIGFGMIFAPRAPNDPNVGGFVLGLSAVLCIVPAALSIWGLAYGSARKKRLARVATLAGTHARLRMDQIATEIGTDVPTARKILLEAVELGLVRGRLDIEDGTFFPEDVAQPEVQHHAAPCPGCGAMVSATIVPGKAVNCTHCGMRLM